MLLSHDILLSLVYLPVSIGNLKLPYAAYRRTYLCLLHCTKPGHLTVILLCIGIYLNPHILLYKSHSHYFLSRMLKLMILIQMKDIVWQFYHLSTKYIR